jgi:DNA-directed RNA polymerase specialized sigma24 family protein
VKSLFPRILAQTKRMCKLPASTGAIEDVAQQAALFYITHPSNVRSMENIIRDAFRSLGYASRATDACDNMRAEENELPLRVTQPMLDATLDAVEKLNGLEINVRAAFILKHRYGYLDTEISKIFGVSSVTIGSWLKGAEK